MIEQVEKLSDIEMPSHGQTVWCSSEDKCYRYDAIEGWQEVPEDGSTEVGMSMYDINKQIISQLPVMSNEGVAEKLTEIKNYVDDLKNTFYMLLCRDINYYTVFMIDGDANEKFEDVLLECLNTFGQIKAIDEIDAAFEIWIENELFDGGPYAFYFFPYDVGVERCK
jgi:hypothetical protein